MIGPPVQFLQHPSVHVHVHVGIGVGVVVIVVVVVVVVLYGVDDPNGNTECGQEEGQNEEGSKY